jgi:uncharacterized linocin/CFP29 family protein
MRGKMKSYAHPIKDATGNDTGEWCYEKTDNSPVQNKPVSEKAKSLADCKTVVEVFNYALANGFTTAKLKEVVGTDKPGEVKTDVTGLINFLSSAGLK